MAQPGAPSRSDQGVAVAEMASRRQELLHGLRDTLPLMLGSIAFGVIFGTLATAAVGPWPAMAMSLFVFSGSAQFIAIILLGTGSSLWVVWFATLVLNLRHLLYAATLVDHVRHLPQSWRFPLAAFLTDETFAVMERRYRMRGGARNAHWYYAGSCLGMYVNWQCWTLVGITVGTQFPDIQGWGLEFAMVVSFIGIVVPLLVSLPYWAAAVTAGAVAVVANPLPYKLGLMLAALTGIAVGLALDLRKRSLGPAAMESSE